MSPSRTGSARNPDQRKPVPGPRRARSKITRSSALVSPISPQMHRIVASGLQMSGNPEGNILIQQEPHAGRVTGTSMQLMCRPSADEPRDRTRDSRAVFATAAVSKKVTAIAWRPVPVLAGSSRSRRRSSHGQTILAMIAMTDDHHPDLRLWVELRGFEPLTPSMRRVCRLVHMCTVLALLLLGLTRATTSRRTSPLGRAEDADACRSLAARPARCGAMRDAAQSYGRAADKRSKRPDRLPAIRPLTLNFLVAGAGFGPATSGS
jgi:hypothetical protein